MHACRVLGRGLPEPSSGREPASSAGRFSGKPLAGVGLPGCRALPLPLWEGRPRPGDTSPLGVQSPAAAQGCLNGVKSRREPELQSHALPHAMEPCGTPVSLRPPSPGRTGFAAALSPPAALSLGRAGLAWMGLQTGARRPLAGVRGLGLRAGSGEGRPREPEVPTVACGADAGGGDLPQMPRVAGATRGYDQVLPGGSCSNQRLVEVRKSVSR